MESLRPQFSRRSKPTPAASNTPHVSSPKGIVSFSHAAYVGLSRMIFTTGMFKVPDIENKAMVPSSPNTPKAANTMFRIPKAVTEPGLSIGLSLDCSRSRFRHVKLSTFGNRACRSPIQFLVGFDVNHRDDSAPA